MRSLKAFVSAALAFRAFASRTNLLMALLVGVAMFMKPQEAKASTPFSCGDTISAVGTYVLNHNELTWDKTVSGPCLTITVSSGSLTTIDCQGYVIKDSGLSWTVPTIKFSSASNVEMDNCVIMGDSSTYINWMSNGCIRSNSSAHIYISYAYLYFCRTIFTDGTDNEFLSSYVENGDVNGENTTGLVVYGNTINDNNSTNLGSYFQAAIAVNGSNALVSYNTIYGPTDSKRTGFCNGCGVGMDDAIVLFGNLNSSTPWTHARVHDNNLYYFSDMGVEWNGYWSDVQINTNTLVGATPTGVSAVAAFGSYFNQYMYTATFQDNVASGSETLFTETGANRDWSVTGNTLTPASGSFDQSSFGSFTVPGHPLTVTNNYFGTGVHLPSLVTDGGGNHCDPTYSTPSPLPITCTWP